MEEFTKENVAKSTRHIYDYRTGLAIMVNLYIIKYIYYHIEKDDMFMEKKGLGRKGKADPIYGKLIPVSRQRFDRINKGLHFEFSVEEATKISDRFGIDIEYFKWDTPKMFEIEGISLDDWKYFYREKYGVKFEISGQTEKNINHISKVEERLKRIVATDWKNQTFKNDPIYNICYYFHNGYRCDRLPRVDVFADILEKMTFEEWKGIDLETRKTIGSLLRSHWKYIEALNTLEDTRNKSKKQK